MTFHFILASMPNLGASSGATGRQEDGMVLGSKTAADREEGAIRRLITEIDSLDSWRDRVGKRILVLFFSTFAGALCLLVWAVTHTGNLVKPPGPRVPGVLHSARSGTR
jgi:hypothetical protein